MWMVGIHVLRLISVVAALSILVARPQIVPGKANPSLRRNFESALPIPSFH